MRTIVPLSFLLLLALVFSCSRGLDKQSLEKQRIADSLAGKGELVIMYDQVMANAVHQIAEEFKQQNPGIEPVFVSDGSRRMAQHITLGSAKADIFITSDYRVIENLLIPWYTHWYYVFAQDEMVIAYSEKSRRAGEINTENWYQILLDSNVHFGRTDPDHAPVGYRTVISIKLAENYYDEEGIKDHLLFKDKRFISATESQLFDLLKKGKVDYVFTYKSEAQQLRLKFVPLPEQLNLKFEKWRSYYSAARVKVDDVEPGKYLERKGEPIRYAICKLNVGNNAIGADKFMHYFILSKETRGIIKAQHIPLIPKPEISPADSTTLELRKEYGFVE
jgi:molybdate/tungstate transport system substrate-binding protein